MLNYFPIVFHGQLVPIGSMELKYIAFSSKQNKVKYNEKDKLPLIKIYFEVLEGLFFFIHFDLPNTDVFIKFPAKL